MSSRHPFLTRLVAALLAAGVLAACGDGTPDEMTSSTMADEMTSSTMADEMTSSTMADEMTSTSAGG